MQRCVTSLVLVLNLDTLSLDLFRAEVLLYRQERQHEVNIEEGTCLSNNGNTIIYSNIKDSKEDCGTMSWM